MTAGVANGASINYYLFSFLPGQEAVEAAVAAGQLDPSTPNQSLIYPSNDLPELDIAYVFDPAGANPLSPAGSGMSKCVAPKNYVFNQRTEAVRHDEQGSIFGSTTGDTKYQPNPLNPGVGTSQLLPDSGGYAPIFQQVAVTSHGEPCQDSNNEADVLKRKDVTLGVDAGGAPKPDAGKFLGWVMVDPSAAIAPNQIQGIDALPPTLGPGRWGWWNHFLTQYLDGGYIPIAGTTPVTTDDPNYAQAACTADAQCNTAVGQTCDVANKVCKPVSVTYTQYTLKSQDLWLATVYPVTNPNSDPIASLTQTGAADFSPAPSPLPDGPVHAPTVNCDPQDPAAVGPGNPAVCNTLTTPVCGANVLFNTYNLQLNGSIPCATTADCTGGAYPGNQMTCVTDPQSATNAKVCVGVAGGMYGHSGNLITYTGGQPALNSDGTIAGGYLDSLGVFLASVPTCAAPAPGSSGGFDLVEPRGDANYSPICQVRAYAPGLDFSNVPDPNNANKLINVQELSPGLVRPADYVGPTAPHLPTPLANPGSQTGTLDAMYGTDAVIPAATIADQTNIVPDANGNPYVYCLQLNN